MSVMYTHGSGNDTPGVKVSRLKERKKERKESDEGETGRRASRDKLVLLPTDTTKRQPWQRAAEDNLRLKRSCRADLAGYRRQITPG